MSKQNLAREHSVQSEWFKVMKGVRQGCIIDDTECVEDIKNRIAKGRGAVIALKSIWKSHSVSMSTKVRLLKTFALSEMTYRYGCESWTLNKRNEEKIRAFEMLGLRRIIRQTHKPVGTRKGWS